MKTVFYMKKCLNSMFFFHLPDTVAAYKETVKFDQIVFAFAE